MSGKTFHHHFHHSPVHPTRVIRHPHRGHKTHTEVDSTQTITNECGESNSDAAIGLLIVFGVAILVLMFRSFSK